MAEPRTAVALLLAAGLLVQRRASGMSVRRRENSSKTTTVSGWLRRSVLGFLLAWFAASAPVHLPAQGLQTGSAVSTTLPMGRLPVALGIAAVLVIAVGYFL